MNQKSVRITNALTALSALAAAVVAVVAISSSGILSAQSTTTTTIDLLNVGMCVTTDDSVFKEKDCDDGDGDETFTVGDRDEIVERESVYATYAHDPLSTTNRPRAILENSDLVKVTISDKGRDRRRSVLYPAAIAGSTQYHTLLDGSAGLPVVAKIKQLIAASDFAEKLTDEQNISAFSNKDIVLYQPRAANGAALIADSGAATLNFRRNGTDPFLPLSDAKDEDEEFVDVVLFFGFEVNEAQASGPEYADVDDVAGAQANIANLKILGAGSAETLIADEDRNSGGGNTPPWLSVLANVPDGKDLAIVAVLYETSDAEVIIGGQACELVGGAGDTRNDCAAEQPVTRPQYTKAERTNEQEIVAEVLGNNTVAQNLYLEENARFTGEYTGYIRLTDANGDDTGSTPTSAKSWGLEFRDGRASTANDLGEAVVRVGSYATIKYRDSKGATIEMAIGIDTQPPAIIVASPTHESSTDDRSPDFIGTFEDGGAGLAEDTFKLYFDNKADAGDGKVGQRLEDTVPVLDIPADNVVIRSPKTQVRDITDYDSDDSFGTLFGVLSGIAGAGEDKIYFTTEDPNPASKDVGPEASVTASDAERKIVNAETYDDGDGQGTFDDDARFQGTETNGREIEVDFQAVVIDLAGNIGFSDADTTRPSHINDFGTKTADRKPLTFHNVLGYFSRHVITLDDKDPEIEVDNTITGYYGLDSDDEPIPHGRGIMITFDNDVSRDNITASTFEVELDDKTKAEVDTVFVDDNLVFLRLSDDLGASETPKITIASGQRVEDFAGNQLLAREVKAFEAKDGVPPTLTVSLSGGSGMGEGKDSESSLTRDKIVVSVSSDEDLGSAPYVSVLCSGFEFTESGTKKDVDDFVEARTGPLTTDPSALNTSGKCDASDTSTVSTSHQQTARGTGQNNWRHTWRNPGTWSDGELVVVVFARDKSVYRMKPGETVPNTQNWGSVTTKFTYDTSIEPLVKSSKSNCGGATTNCVLPGPGAKVSENRPFIVLDFGGEGTAVEIEKLQLNDVDVTARVEPTDDKRFIYWPDGLNLGTHKVEVDARDAAGNETTFRYEFEKVTRSDFILKLLAGWNAVSLPQNPVDGSLESVFKDPKITQVISYSRTSDEETTGTWNVATRLDGIWTTSIGYLTSVGAGPGYWVNADNFVNQSITLRSAERLSRDLPAEPVGLNVYDGWNFVGVVDQTGEQTQNDFGKTLMNANDAPHSGMTYLGNYVRAYTWNPTLIRFEELEKAGRGVRIGDGIWVYYGEGLAP